MQFALIPHPDFPCPAVQSMTVWVKRAKAERLELHYEVIGDLDELNIPLYFNPYPSDPLWMHTCFEAFIAGRDKGYLELNFSSSLECAGYRFTSYRDGITDLDIEAYDMEYDLEPCSFCLDVVIDVPVSGDWKLNLSTIIEDKTGQRSFWALAHPPGQPDFHDPDCFVLTLPAPDGA